MALSLHHLPIRSSINTKQPRYFDGLSFHRDGSPARDSRNLMQRRMWKVAKHGRVRSAGVGVAAAAWPGRRGNPTVPVHDLCMAVCSLAPLSAIHTIPTLPVFIDRWIISLWLLNHTNPRPAFTKVSRIYHKMNGSQALIFLVCHMNLLLVRGTGLTCLWRDTLRLTESPQPI